MDTILGKEWDKVRKYLFEAGLNVFPSYKRLVLIEDLEEISKKDKHHYHIYAILSYDQVFFDMQKTKTTEKGIKPVVFNGSGSKRKEYELPLFTIAPELDHRKIEMEIPFPPTKMNVCIKDERFLKQYSEIYHSELDVMAQELFEDVSECVIDKQAFEVLYIGQAYGKNGERTAFDRLEQHSTLQKILTKYRNENPDKHIYVLLLEIQKQLAMSFDGISKEYEKTEEESDKHMDEICCNIPEDEQVINITEAALINYFKPEYNVNFIDNFPDENHKGYKKYHDLDYNALSVELDLEFDHAPIIQLYTSTNRINSSFDFIRYQLFNDNERSNMYEIFTKE